jgi:hypothetical protein
MDEKEGVQSVGEGGINDGEAQRGELKASEALEAMKGVETNSWPKTFRFIRCRSRNDNNNWPAR